jgi:small redox-active disulfide protein 2
MSKVLVEVIGVEPPCPKCKAALKTVNEAVEKLGLGGRIEVVKKNIMSDEVIDKYGVLISPSIAIDGDVKIKGRVPSLGEVENLLKSILG